MHPPNPDALLLLISGLRNPKKEFRAECITKIILYEGEAVAVLIPLLHDTDWRVRYRAAEALGLIDDARSVPDLIETCSDEKDHVRYMAAKSLGILRTSDAVPVLTSLLTDDHPYTRGIAAEGLAAIGDIIGKSEIQSALERESDPAIKERMIRSLKSF